MAAHILVVDDEKIIRESIAFILKKEGYSVMEAENGKIAYEAVMTESFDIVITDLEMPEMKGIELLDRITQVNPHTAVIIITAYGSLDTAIAALRKGASDYILKPVEFDELLLKIKNILDRKNLLVENQIMRRELNRQYNFSNIVGESPAMQKIFGMIKLVADTQSTVLITGKSGSGKELIARAIHYHSRRRDKPFIAVNCGAIPETLIESELFGIKKGAFTGAVSDRIGLFKAADGGSLLLDEVSEMPPQLQVKLLRAIEQKEISPVGASGTISVDVRIIASTNRDLEKEVQAGRFREDLYYRFNVVEIRVPSLSERVEDIPLLVEYFVNKYKRELRRNIIGVDNEVIQVLMNHEWKGEVRELENIIERAVIFCKGERISINDLTGINSKGFDFQLSQTELSLDNIVKHVGKQYIISTLQKNNFDKVKTAKALKISLPTLYRRIKDLKIQDKS